MDAWPQRLAEEHPERNTALEELRSVLFRSLRKRLLGRAGTDISLLEDIVQDALLRILDHLHTFQNRSQFTSWALSITFRVAYNELRKREWGHVSLEELQDKQETIPEEHDSSLSPDEKATRQDMIRVIRTVIENDLTPRQRDVMLGELNGMPQEEIARQLGTNRNNVYKLFHDARKALKRALEARGHSPHTLLSVAPENKSQGLTP